VVSGARGSAGVIVCVVALIAAACGNDTSEGSGADEARSGSAASSSTVPSEGAPPNGVSVLAVVSAGGGTLDAVGGRRYELTLNDVAPKAVWFADRPARLTGTYTIPELDDAFFASKSPPNAALEVLEPAEGAEVVVFELAEPRYDEDERHLVYEAKLLDEDAVVGSGLARHRQRADGSVPDEFGTAALFIDDAPSCTANDGAGGSGVITSLNGIECDVAKLAVSFDNAPLCGSDPIVDPFPVVGIFTCASEPFDSYSYTYTPNSAFPLDESTYQQDGSFLYVHTSV